MAIVFVVCTFKKNKNVGAVFEWIIALIFTFYVLTFFIDLYPAWHAKQAVSNEEMGTVDAGDYSRNEYAGAYEAQDRGAVPQAVPPPRSDYDSRNGTMSSDYGHTNGAVGGGYTSANGAVNGNYVNGNTRQEGVLIEHAGPGFDKVEPSRNF